MDMRIVHALIKLVIIQQHQCVTILELAHEHLMFLRCQII